MPGFRFTEAALEKVRPPKQGRVEYWDTSVGSLVGLQVSATGARSWIVRPRILANGAWKTAKVTIGRPPGMSLKEARQKAEEVTAAARQGEDTRRLQTKERKGLQEESRNTFGVFADGFLARHVSKLRASTRREYERTLKGPRNDDGERVHPWRDRPIASITKRDVRNLIDSIADGGSPIQASRQLGYLKKFFSWCAGREEDLFAVLPTDRVPAPAKSVPRDRALSNAEVVEVYRAIVEDPGRKQGGQFRALLATLLLTGQRREEVAGMRWSELTDLHGKTPKWEIPKERTKNKRPHIVPLSPQVVAFLRTLPRILGSDLVFTTTGETSVSGFSRAKIRVDAAIAENREKSGIKEKIPDWTIHDLRRTVSTRMNEDLGIQPHIVEAVLNHVSGTRAGVAGTYNRAIYLEEKRRALEAWANHVDNLMSNAAAARENDGRLESSAGRRA